MKDTVRMCVSCRARFAKPDLIRIVYHDGALAIDHTCRMPGRGAYICRNDKCLSRVISKKLLNGPLKAELSDEDYKKLTELKFGEN